MVAFLRSTPGGAERFLNLMKFRDYPWRRKLGAQLWRLTLCTAALTGLLAALFFYQHVTGDSTPTVPPDVLRPVRQPNGQWRVTWATQPGRTYEVLRASDLQQPAAWNVLTNLVAAGSSAFMDDSLVATQAFYRVRVLPETAPSFASSDPSRFIPLDGNGRPQEGSLVMGTNGVLPPFIFRPGGNAEFGFDSGLGLTFASGGRETNIGGRVYLSFTNLVAAFGSNSPVQFRNLLSYHNSTAVLLPLGPADVSVLAGILSGNSTNGLDVTLFRRYPVKITGGTFDDTGLRNARLDVRDSGLPLPAASGNYPEFTLNLSDRFAFRLPFWGEFTLPDGTVTPGHVSVSSARPIWLELKPSGQIALSGRAQLEFENGPLLEVDFSFDDPNYQLQAVAGGLHVPLLDSLADLLPSTPSVPVTTDTNQLALARQKLACFDRALLHFSASAVGLAQPTNSALSAPPQFGVTAHSVLDAWGFTSGCDLSAPKSGAPLQGTLANAGQSAAAARHLQDVLEQWLSLRRIQQAMGSGALSADASLQTEITTALAQAEAAAIARANGPDAVQSLGNLQLCLQTLVDIEVIRQQLGLAANPQLTAAMSGLMQRFATDYCDGLGISNGVYTLSPVVADMDHFTAGDHLRTLVKVMMLSQQLGCDGAITAPINETIGQLALRTWAQINANLSAAEAANDYLSFLYTMEETVEFVALEQTGIFPQVPALAGLPNGASLSPLGGRLGNVMTADLSKPYGERSIGNQRQELRRLLQVLASLPSNVSYPPQAIQRAYTRLESAFTNAFTTGAVYPLSDSLVILEAGILQAQLRDRFNLASPVSWETNRLPVAVQRIAQAAQAQNGWSELHQAVGLLLKEADHQAVIGQGARCRLYLDKAAELLTVARGVGTALWQEQGSLSHVADMLLPGDVYVDRVAGAIQYNRLTEELAGACSGQIRLPNFNLSLALDNASFTSGGAFNLTAHGSLGVPIDSPSATLSIPARRPLQISFRPPDQLTMASGARIALNNGMAFEGFVSLADPVYSFGIAAEGVRFDLATNALIYVPDFPTANQFGPAAGRTLNEYYQSLNGALESLSGLTNTPALQPVGAPPEFADSTFTIPGAPLLVWANSVLLDVTNNVNRSYVGTTNLVREQLGQLASATLQQRDELEESEVYLRGQVLIRLAEAIQARSLKAAAQGASKADVEAIYNSPELRAYVESTHQAADRFTGRTNSTLLGRASALRAIGSVMLGLQRADIAPDLSLQLLQKTEVMSVKSVESNLSSLGLNPTNGLVQNPGLFTNVPPEKLWGALTNLLLAQLNLQSIGAGNPASVMQAQQTMGMRYREIKVRRLRALSVTNEQHLVEIGRITFDLKNLQEAQEKGLFEYPGTPIVQLQGPDAVTLPGSDRERTNFFGKIVEFTELARTNARAVDLFLVSLPRSTQLDLFGFKKLAREQATKPQPMFRTNSPTVTFLNRNYSNEVARLKRDLQSPWTTERMAEGVKLLDDLATLQLWAQRYSPGDLPELQGFTTNLTFKMIGSARAKTNSWLLNRYIQIALDAAELKAGNDANVLSNVLVQAASDSLTACRSISQDLRLLLPTQRPYDLRLPGDVVVRRAAGSVTYNRTTRLLSGRFDGRLEFPDLQNAYFEITNAVIDNALNFSVGARTAGPLPFDGVKLTASLLATGGVSKPFLLNGTGLMSVRNGPDVNVNLLLTSAPRRLSFDTAASNLDLRFTDDAVLFNSGFGFDILPDAQAGRLRVSGSAGFFAKGVLPTNQVSRTNFHLFADGITVSIAFQPGQADLTFSNGVLHLPEFFYATNVPPGLCTNLAGPATGPQVALVPQNPIRATFREGPTPTIGFSGQLNFRELGLAVPQISGLAAAMCNANLVFPSNSLPYLTNVNGALRVPLPQSTNDIALRNGVFTLNGFPSGRIELVNDLPLVNAGGFKFILLGSTNQLCTNGTGLTVFPSLGLDQLPTLRLDGGMRVEAPVDMLTSVSNDVATGLACGSLTLTNSRPPILEVSTLQFGGTFHLGGASGVILSNALLTLEGLPNIFNLSPATPFRVRVDGKLILPDGPGFALNNAAFTFFDKDRLPKFTVDGLGYDATSFTLAQSLPAGVDAAYISFKNSQLELPYLLSPTNLALRMTAHVSVPPDEPIMAGRIENIGLSVTPEGMLKVDSIAGLELEMSGFDIPPVEEISGRLYIGGLADVNGTPTPEKMYFAGRAAGSYQGYKLKMLLAFNLTGPIGMCLDVNAGSAGIPLGQTSFLLTGAGGGISFANNGGDPCAFTSYLNTNGQPISTFVEIPAAISWSNFNATVTRMANAAIAFTPPPPVGGRGTGNTTADLGNNFDCPGGCPPPTINIFCQPHPDPANFPGRVIMKFSSIDEKTLNNVLHISPATFDGVATNAIAVATNVAHQLRMYVQNNTPPPDVSQLPPDKVAAIMGVMNQTFDALEYTVGNILLPALATNTTAAFYTVIRDTVRAGVPCPDITLQVNGTFSQLAVSSFLSGTVGAVISSTGNAGLVGHVNIIGLPMGNAKGFIAATDEKGLPNPSVCGEIQLGFGPLDLGVVRASMNCRDCVTGILDQFGKLAVCLGEPLVRQVASNAVPRLNALNLPPAQLLNAMTDTEKIGFMANVFQLPPETLATLPGGQLPECFLQQFQSAWDVVNPYLVMCGQSQTKLFGIPIGPELGAVSAEASKTNIAAVTSFSPTFVILAALDPRYAALTRSILPIEDNATLGFNVSFPDAAQAMLAGMSGKLSSPEALTAYGREQFDYMLQHATYTMQFELRPIGGKGLDSQARVILPDLTNHPARPGSGWLLPDKRSTNYLTREDLLLTLLSSNLLASTFWTGEDLGEVDPRLSGLSLRKDYFPHGGMMGAARIMMPRALTDTPPTYLPALLDPNSSTPPVEKLQHAIDYLQNYVLNFHETGALTFYTPAPNPPFFTNSAGQNLGPQDLLTAISSFDFKGITNAQVAALYPFDLAFLKGYFDAQLLGFPVAHGVILGLPPAPEEGRDEAVLRLDVQGTPQGWLAQFVTTNHLVFDLQSAPPRPMETWANEVVQELITLATDGNASTAQLKATADNFAASLKTNLPKVKLEADLQLQMPVPISDILGMSGQSVLHAYSPQFDPYFEPTNQAPMARIKREGGVAFQGAAELRVGPVKLVDIDEAQFSLLPRGDAMPEISARLVAPVLPFPPDEPVITLRNVGIDFANLPQPRFHGAGTLDLFSIGTFDFVGAAGFDFGGAIDVASLGSGQAQAIFTINPATLLLDTYGNQLLIHGTTRQDPFVFSPTGPWTAAVELTNAINLLNVVEMGNGGLFMPMTFTGNGRNLGTVTTSLKPNAALTLFPANATLRRDITVSAGVAGTLTLGSDGQFLLTGQLGGSALDFNGISVPAGAFLTASNAGVAFTWTLNGVNGSLRLGTNGQVGGNSEFPPLDFGIFRISGAGGANLAGTFSSSGFAVNNGAELKLNADWLGAQVLTLMSFTYSNTGAISVSANIPPGGLLFAGYPFDPTALTFTRTATNSGGVATLALSGLVHGTPNFPGFPAINLTGQVSSAGAVLLQAASGGTNFYGFPVLNYTNTFTQAAGSYLAQLRAQFRLGNNTGPWTALGNNQFDGTFAPDGSFRLQSALPSVSLAGFAVTNPLFVLSAPAGGRPATAVLEGDLQLNGFSGLHLTGSVNTNGNFLLLPAPPAPAVPVPYPQFNANVAINLNNSGLHVSGGLQQPPLPLLTLVGDILTNGAFTLTNSLASLSVNGFGLNNALITLQRNAGQPAFVTGSGQLAVPGLSSFPVSGGFTNDGTYGLTSTVSGNTALTGLPVTTLSNNAALTWSQNGVAFSGTLGGGVLANVLPVGAVSGQIGVDSAGAKTVAATVTVASLTNNQFIIRPSGGGNFTATLNNAGLTLPAGAELVYRGRTVANLPLPAITVQSNGDFSVVVGSPTPVSFTLEGFGLTHGSFTLQRVGGVISISSFNADLAIPGLNAAATVTGSLTNDGTFSLTGSIGNALGVSGLPVTQLASGASVNWNQSRLLVNGSVSGNIFNTVNASGVTGSIEVSTNGTLNLGATVTIPTLTVGAFTITNPAASTIALTLTNDGLRFPSGLRLVFNGTGFTTFTLPAFTNDANGNFSFGVSGQTLALAGFTSSGTAFTFTRNGGTATLAVTAGTLGVPGFSTALNVSITGSLSSAGTFTLTNSSAFSPSARTPSVANVFGAIGLSSGSQLTFGRDGSGNTSLRLSGTLSGGCLNGISSGFVTSNGLLFISSGGTITPTASFTLAELLLADKTSGFHLAPFSGGNFTVNLGPAGLSFPTGARLYYRNQALGNFNLPMFTIPANGSVSVGFGNTPLSLDGFSVTAGGTLNRSASNGTVILTINAGASLPLPGLGASTTVSGAITNNGTYLLVNNSAGTFSLPNLPVTSMGSTVVALGRQTNVTTLRLTGNLAGGVFSGGNADDLRLVTSGVSVTLSTGGTPTLNASVNVRAFTNSLISVEGSGGAGANISATLNNTSLTLLSGARLRTLGGGLLSATVTLPTITVPVSGDFTLPISTPLPVISVNGFAFSNVTFNLHRYAPSGDVRELRIENLAGSLGLNNFGQGFSGGTLYSDGTINFDWSGTLNLNGFAGSSGYLQLRNTGLTAGGTFNITALGHTFNSSLGLTGSVFSGGSYTLTGSGPLNINGYSLTGNAALQLGTGGLVPQGTPQLNYNGLSVPLNSLSINGVTGISFNAATTRSRMDLIDAAPNPPLPDCAQQGDVYGYIDGTVSLNLSSGSGSFSSSFNGTFGWWVVTTDHSGNPPGFGDRYSCNSAPNLFSLPTAQPSNASSGRFSTGNLSVSSSGDVTVGGTYGPASDYHFDLW